MSIFKKICISSTISLFFAYLSIVIVYACGKDEVDTALGCIGTQPDTLATWVLTNAIKVAGGIAFLLMLYGGFLFLTSAGDPNKLQEATDVIMSAIAGLLMIIFSVFLLRLIGYDILQIF